MVQWIPAFAGMTKYATCHSRESGNPSCTRIIPPLIAKEPELKNRLKQVQENIFNIRDSQIPLNPPLLKGESLVYLFKIAKEQSTINCATPGFTFGVAQFIVPHQDIISYTRTKHNKLCNSKYFAISQNIIS